GKSAAWQTGCHLLSAAGSSPLAPLHFSSSSSSSSLVSPLPLLSPSPRRGFASSAPPRPQATLDQSIIVWTVLLGGITLSIVGYKLFYDQPQQHELVKQVRRQKTRARTRRMRAGWP